MKSKWKSSLEKFRSYNSFIYFSFYFHLKKIMDVMLFCMIEEEEKKA